MPQNRETFTQAARRVSGARYQRLLDDEAAEDQEYEEYRSAPAVRSAVRRRRRPSLNPHGGRVSDSQGGFFWFLSAVGFAAVLFGYFLGK